MSKIRVLVVDDHAMVREGFRMLLGSHDDIDVVGEAGDGNSAVDKAGELLPDLVLMDITMPGLSGLEATRRIKVLFPGVQVLAITGSEGEDAFFKAVQAGASGYVLKGGTGTELITAVRTVMAGHVFLQPPMARKLMEDYLQRLRAGQEQDSYESLSERERVVFQMSAEGYTNQEIAAKLIISPSTVQTHRSHAMEKLNLRSRSELVKYAARKGLIREVQG